MGATGVFLATAQGVVVTVRNTTVFVLPINDACRPKMLQFQVLQGDDAPAEVLEEVLDEEEPATACQNKHVTKPALRANRITSVELLGLQRSKVLALLLLVDERRLMHYELNLSAETLVLKASRSVPRSATCMTVGHLKLVNGETKDAVIIGQKTGEVVAVPFPDVARDLKMLLGHTTSMVTHVAVNHDSSLLLTADRDEKLRVSRFPNAMIIESYCLGHAASLTKVACSSVTPELVVTTSMDNTLKLWHLKSGKLLATEALLPSVEVSIETLGDGDADDYDNSGKAAKSLLNVSLAISLKTNMVAVLVNHQYVRFFEIVSADGVHAFKEVSMSSEDEQLLLANEPCELVFTEDEVLAVSYKKNPFLRLFSIREGESKKLLPLDSMTDVFKELWSAAATIELVAEQNALDVFEYSLKKKKARTGEWNKMVPEDK